MHLSTFKPKTKDLNFISLEEMDKKIKKPIEGPFHHMPPPDHE